jgi:hypothetical protein
MVLNISKLLLTPLGAPNIELGVTLVSETHTAVKLYSSVSRI